MHDLNEYELPSKFPQIVSTTGSGPIREKDLIEYLKENGCEVYAPFRKEVELLIVGEEGAMEERIREWASNNERGHNCICQHQFLDWLSNGNSPIDSAEDDSESDRCLDIVSRIYLEVLADYEIDTSGLAITPKHGVLNYFNYHVGDSSLDSEAIRKARLYAVFLSEIPIFEGTDEEYISEWGRPGTPKRAEKMIRTIRSLAELSRRKPGIVRTVKTGERTLFVDTKSTKGEPEEIKIDTIREYTSTAIREWESDLDWVRRALRPIARES